jgi:hypothetical protein
LSQINVPDRRTAIFRSAAKQGVPMSRDVRVDERLWSTAVAPEGVLEWWFHSDGAEVAVGDKLAEVLIEGASHDVMAPAAGILQVLAFAGSVLDPGCIIGQVS